MMGTCWKNDWKMMEKNGMEQNDGKMMGKMMEKMIGK